MLLQAHSIDTFVQVPITHYVFIEDCGLDYHVWVDALSPHYNKEKNHNLIVYYGVIPREVLRDDGWSRQQYLKLNAINYVNDDYMILDSKNFFIKHTTLDYEIYEGTWFRNTAQDVFPSAVPFYYYLVGYLKKEAPPYSYTGHTPFFIKKETMDRLQKECDLLDVFSRAVRNGLRPSEFLLYSFFANCKDIRRHAVNWWTLYNDENIIYHTYWWDRELDPSKFEEIYNSNIEILGLHRNVWFNKDDRMEQLAQWLCAIGLEDIHVYAATVCMDWGDAPILNGE